MGNFIKDGDTIKSTSNGVIENAIAYIPGGVSLDTTGITGIIPAGTPIIKDTGVFKPLAEADLATDGAKTVGYLFKAINAEDEDATVVVQGVIREAKMPYVINADVKGATPGVVFV